jgi:hypothetical protein
MRYRLRTLLILLAIGPPILAWSAPHIAKLWPREKPSPPSGWEPTGPTADLDIAFDQAAFDSDKPWGSRSGFDVNESPSRNTSLSDYLSPSALAVAFTIASDVIVALLVVSIPFTLCLAMIFLGVSVRAE